MPAQSRFLWRAGPPLVRGAGRAFFSLKIEREADIPPPPFVLAANHYSHFDPAIIPAAMGVPVRFLALDHLFGVNRLLDWLLYGFGSIPTPRERLPIRAVKVALARLEAGEVVGVFPEATRVSHWGTLPAKRGAAWLAARSGLPLVPVAIIGTGRALGLENRLRRAPIRVVIGEAVRPEGYDATTLTDHWAEWMTDQVNRFPGSEVSGPRRHHHSG